MKLKPSRVLNESSQLLGITANDLILIGVVFLLLQQIFIPLELEFVPLVVMFILVLLLVSIRMSCRKKIIRDTIQYFLRKFILNGYCYVGERSFKN